MGLEETCGECGKTISKRAIAHVIGEKIVCNECKKRIDAAAAREAKQAEKTAREAQRKAEALEAEIPTAKQIAYATHLGIVIPPGIKRYELSDLIDEAQDERRAEREDAAEEEERERIVIQIKQPPRPHKHKRAARGCLVVLALAGVWIATAGVMAVRWLMSG